MSEKCVKCGLTEDRLILDACGYRHWECPAPVDAKTLAMQIVRLPRGTGKAEIPHTQTIPYQLAVNQQRFGHGADIDFVRLWKFDVEMLQEIAQKYLEEFGR